MEAADVVEVKAADWEGPKIRRCSVEEVFNLPLFELYLVIDTRSDAEVEEAGGKRVSSARPLPQDLNLGYAENLHRFLEEIEEESLWPVRWRQMVVYDTGALTDYSQRIANSMRTALVAGAADPSHCRRNLFRTVEEIWLLEGGYGAFRDAFPALCGVEVEDMTPSPAQIVPGLYLASRAMPLDDRKTFDDWGITHVITDAETKVAPLPGLEQLECALRDDQREDFSESFHHVYIFIQEALSNMQRNRVLVKFWGRSRSATLIIAWVMKAYSFTPEQAFDFVQRKVFKPIDSSLIAIDQLREWQVSRIR